MDVTIAAKRGKKVLPHYFILICKGPVQLQSKVQVVFNTFLSSSFDSF